MEGFVKVIKKKNLTELKRYFFYLTYDNRAQIDKEIDNVKENKFNKMPNIDITNPITTYWSYKKSIDEEWKKDRTKGIEIILSYSKKFNQLMINTIGEKQWQSIYRNIVKTVINKNAKTKASLFYFHKFDKTGYRYHSHVILYPYKTENKGNSVLYTYIPYKELKQIKLDFYNSSKIITKKFEKQIKDYILKMVNLSKLEYKEEIIFEEFISENKDLKNYLNLF